MIASTLSPDVARCGPMPTLADVASSAVAAAQVEVVVRNYSTDGSNFRESRGVTRSPVVLQCAVGTTFQVHSWSATYYVAVRTKEFETQDGLHFFGGLKGQLLF